MKKELEVIWIDEKTIFQSLVSDIITFGLMIFTMWLNYQFFGNGVIIQCFFLFIVLAVLVDRDDEKKKRMSQKEALSYLTDLIGADAK